jgi:CarD family transcriptional regulator
MTFRLGEKVVYPTQGIGTIENISRRSFGNQVESFYLLRLSEASMTVMVPFSHVAHVGLRRLTSQGELARVLSFLAEGGCAHRRDWKSRFRENTEKMRGGGLLVIAEVLKSLLLQQREKPLSFGEKRMLDRARHMLVTELSISRGLGKFQAVELIERALAKAALSLPPEM